MTSHHTARFGKSKPDQPPFSYLSKMIERASAGTHEAIYLASHRMMRVLRNRPQLRALARAAGFPVYPA